MSFKQAGGIAGVSRGCDVDTSTLTGPEGEELARLVRGLESEPASAGPSGGGGPRPDAASYLIRIEEGGRVREHKLSDGTMSQPAGELVRFLSSRAKPRRI